uniref:Uncharacterized protein n=1 Tax=Clastoptera arizonana TaxID=38151 RepID=A0A1B6DEB0_9HEMI
MKSGEQYKPNQFNTNQFQTSSPYPQKQPKNAKGYSTYQINPNDEEINDDPRFHHSFNNSVVRAKFIRKVYTILTLQLSFTVIFVLPFMFIDEVQEFVDDYFMLVYVGLALFIIPYIMLICWESIRRSFPTNIILLCLMTLGLSIICGFTTARLSTEVVFYSFLTTLVVTATITVMAIFCPFDITSCGMVLCILTLILAIYGMIAIILTILLRTKIYQLIFSAIAVILFSLYLMYDTQVIMGGRSVTIDPEDYIQAASQLYIDIVYIFLHLLHLYQACTEG